MTDPLAIRDEVLAAAYHAFRAFTRLGPEAARPILSKDVVLELPGHNPLAGTYRGRESFIAHLRDLDEKTGGTRRFSLVSVDRVEDGLVATLEVTATRRSRTIKVHEIAHATFRHGLVSHVRVEFPELAKWDEFWK